MSSGRYDARSSRVELEAFEAGQQYAGNPIVLCHGWPDSACSWRHQMSALAGAGHHVIGPDQPGYGYSSHPGAPQPRFPWR